MTEVPRGPLLEMKGLRLTTRSGPVVRDIDLTIRSGECVGIVGASGAGKTLTALSVVRLLPRGVGAQGRIMWKGSDLLNMPEERIRGIRGREIGMVFQDALGALHPALTVIEQVAEALTAHGCDRAEARDRATLLLESVGIDRDAATAPRYPHEWSGGMRQRALIAIAIANEPELLIADEPTTALDVTTQARVLDVLRNVHERSAASLIIITHDLGVIAEMADRVVVMHEGRVVEEGPTHGLFRSPRHPHTRELLERRPGLGPFRSARASMGALSAPVEGDSAPASRALAGGAVALRVEELTVTYARRGHPSVRALERVTFHVAEGETYGLVGESGSGKTTLARTLVGLVAPDAGRVQACGETLADLTPMALRRLRGRVQIVFQDPRASLNPRRAVGDIIAQPLYVHGRGAEAAERVPRLLTRVGLRPSDAGKKPNEFSGGQLQRVAIARALALGPEVLILDEPVSALDTVVQARIISLLDELRDALGLSMVLIAHDLALVAGLSHRIGVMRSGRIVEEGTARQICAAPAHPYTQDLLASQPRWEPSPPEERNA